MTPNAFGPAGTGGADYDSDYMSGGHSNSGYGMNPGMGPGFSGNVPTGFGSGMGNPGTFQPGFPGGMGYQGGFQPGWAPGFGFSGGFQPGFGPGMGFQNNFPPGFGMPFQGGFSPGMGFQPGFGSAYPGTFQPGFNMTPSIGPGFAGNFQPGFGPGIGPFFGQDETMGQGTYPTQFAATPMQMGWGLGGMRRWGGSYSPQFMMTGLPTDEEIVEMVYDAIDNDPLIPYDAEINVDADAGTVTLSGTVMNKQIKHAAGDDAWWIPGVDDVHNELNVERRRPAQGAEEMGMESRGQAGATPSATQGQRSETPQTPRASRRGVTRR